MIILYSEKPSTPIFKTGEPNPDLGVQKVFVWMLPYLLFVVFCHEDV